MRSLEELLTPLKKVNNLSCVEENNIEKRKKSNITYFDQLKMVSK